MEFKTDTAVSGSQGVGGAGPKGLVVVAVSPGRDGELVLEPGEPEVVSPEAVVAGVVVVVVELGLLSPPPPQPCNTKAVGTKKTQHTCFDCMSANEIVEMTQSPVVELGLLS